MTSHSAPVTSTSSCSSLTLVLFANPNQPSPRLLHYAMVNLATDPLPFLPRGGAITDGGGALRKFRSVVTLTGQHVKRNEDLAIAECEDLLDFMGATMVVDGQGDPWPVDPIQPPQQVQPGLEAEEVSMV
ncbi:hypothetical protein GUJ93_ZPchr0001g30947 [Zizania palustris]|uniref:DUF7597 domain-containing protein n=1 Tax=Zizania palustris TaxID=103762 RepID=A0A8J5VAC6_ZIZPA|nr:hypothetical protein GUJ93_ZPchr0001g30947 [Zizania palustris]